VSTLGFEHLKEMYKQESCFKEAYDACENPMIGDRSPWVEYIIQERLLFKGT
jgi:hypothetical protein